MSAIDNKWAQLGGAGGFLGQPIDEGAGSQEMDTFDHTGRVRDFQGGTIIWSPATGAFEVHGDIRVKWAQLGGERGFLGYPTTDEIGTPNGRGRFNHFQGGSIYWTPGIGAHEVHGDIRQKWAEMGWEAGRLGFPKSDERSTSDGQGRFSIFEGGTVFWTPPHNIRVDWNID